MTGVPRAGVGDLRRIGPVRSTTLDDVGIGGLGRRGVASVAPAVVILAALVACSGDDDTTETTPPTAQTTTTTTPATTTTSSSTSTSTTTTELPDVFVVLSFPPQGFEFTTSAAEFRGVTTPGTRIEIGPFATTATGDGSWALQATLGPETGPLEVVVVAIDRLGRRAETTVDIVYSPTIRTSTTSEPSF